MKKCLGKLVGDRQGQALVEMALVLPILLLLLWVFLSLGTYECLADNKRPGPGWGAARVVGYSDRNIKDLVEDRRAWLETDRLQVEISPRQLVEKRDPLE